MNQHGGAQAYIVSVGGFLGMADRHVAINPSDLKVSYNDSDKKWHATMNTVPNNNQVSAAAQI
jgi:hypothetical protein